MAWVLAETVAEVLGRAILPVEIADRPARVIQVALQLSDLPAGGRLLEFLELANVRIRAVTVRLYCSRSRTG